MDEVEIKSDYPEAVSAHSTLPAPALIQFTGLRPLSLQGLSQHAELN